MRLNINQVIERLQKIKNQYPDIEDIILYNDQLYEVSDIKVLTSDCIKNSNGEFQKTALIKIETCEWWHYAWTLLKDLEIED